MKNLVTEIWEIRAIVDQAIENKSQELFFEAYDRFMKISESGMHLQSSSLNTMDKKIESRDEEVADRRANWDRLVFNLGMLGARTTEKYVEIPYGKAKSLLDVIWLARAMFDDCCYSARTDRVLTRFAAMEDKLAYVYHNLKYDSLDEQKAVLKIREEIRNSREYYFGNRIEPSLFDSESSCY